MLRWEARKHRTCETNSKLSCSFLPTSQASNWSKIPKLPLYFENSFVLGGCLLLPSFCVCLGLGVALFSWNGYILRVRIRFSASERENSPPNYSFYLFLLSPSVFPHLFSLAISLDKTLIRWVDIFRFHLFRDEFVNL